MTTARDPHSVPLSDPTGLSAGASRIDRADRADDLGQPLSDIGRIVGNITEDLSALVRQETELAKAEIKQSASRAGKGAGLFAGGGVAAHMALLFLSIALWWGIANLIESFGWAALIVGVLWAIAAAVMAAMGRKEMTKIRGLQRTTETAARIPDALKGNETTHG
ncbi:phage holin family protein [Cumulibacter manganitolerans]|uniref:phage holin family protein n=1 Tax=Cumulibacter manganitolerans TaxID=1884992 RepID=UPI001294ED89|nr:phage holin family protein [Cumulibacter manganitolerans]